MYVDTSAILSSRERLLHHRRHEGLNNAASRRPSTFARRPEALPTVNYYERFPHRVGCTGNVCFTTEEELEPWLLVARPVSREEAEKYGGCIIYSPPSPPDGRDNKKEQQPSQYYCITDTDDEVYGRAEYLLFSALAVADADGVEEEEGDVFTNAFDCFDGVDGVAAVTRCEAQKPSCVCEVSGGWGASRTSLLAPNDG